MVGFARGGGGFTAQRVVRPVIGVMPEIGVMRKKVPMMVRRLLRFRVVGRVIRVWLGDGVRGSIFVDTSCALGWC